MKSHELIQKNITETVTAIEATNDRKKYLPILIMLRSALAYISTSPTEEFAQHQFEKIETLIRKYKIKRLDLDALPQCQKRKESTKKLDHFFDISTLRKQHIILKYLLDENYHPINNNAPA